MKSDISAFLSTYPLYKPYKLAELTGPNTETVAPRSLHHNTFQHFCEREDFPTTFILVAANDTVATALNRISLGGEKDSILDSNRNLNYILHFEGRCQSCSEYKIDLLLRVWGNKPIPFSTQRSSSARGTTPVMHPPSPQGDSGPTEVFIEKIGQFPPFTTDINKNVVKFFDRESQTWYFKGNKALNEGYGIGAYAYFRRIIEKELLHIVRDIGKLPSHNSEKINSMLREYEEQQKPYLIYRNVFELLPKSLQTLGVNPLEFLYQKKSEALQELTEQQCQETAEAMNKILTFVILKIYEEKSEIVDIRNAIKLVEERSQNTKK